MHENIALALEGNTDIDTLWRLIEYPDSPALTEIRKASVCIVFLDFSDPIRAKAVAAELDNSYPMATLVAVHAGGPSLNLIDLMQLGIREVLTMPATSAEVARGALTQVLREGEDAQSGRGRRRNLYASLPWPGWARPRSPPMWTRPRHGSRANAPCCWISNT